MDAAVSLQVAGLRMPYKDIRVWIVILAAIFLWPNATNAQTGPDEQVLVDVATAKDVSKLESHLPEIVRSQIAALPTGERRALEEDIFFVQKLREEGAMLKAPEDGRALLLLENPRQQQRIEIRVDKKISNGAESMMVLKALDATSHSESATDLGTIIVWMKLEDGNWTITELQSPTDRESLKFDEHFVEKFKHDRFNANEASAVGNMRTLNTAEVTYASTFTEIGFAASIEVLGGNGGDAQQAGLIDSELAEGVKSGYKFEYRGGSDSPRTSYQITARPVHYGTTGKRSFFTDQSGVIRFTEEDREPTAQDDPLH